MVPKGALRCKTGASCAPVHCAIVLFDGRKLYILLHAVPRRYLTNLLLFAATWRYPRGCHAPPADPVSACQVLRCCTAPCGPTCRELDSSAYYSRYIQVPVPNSTLLIATLPTRPLTSSRCMYIHACALPTTKSPRDATFGDVHRAGREGAPEAILYFLLTQELPHIRQRISGNEKGAPCRRRAASYRRKGKSKEYTIWRKSYVLLMSQLIRAATLIRPWVLALLSSFPQPPLLPPTSDFPPPLVHFVRHHQTKASH